LGVKISVNQSFLDVAEGATLRDVLAHVDIEPDRRGIAVAVNDQVVRRQQWAEKTVANGDRIEIIQATQGG